MPKQYLQRKTSILFNADNVMGINLNKQTSEWNTEGHFLKYYKALKSFGAPVDFVRDTANFTNYPVLVVPAYQMIDSQMIDKMKSYAQNGGNLVITCRTGLQNNYTSSKALPLKNTPKESWSNTATGLALQSATWTRLTR